MMITEDYGVCLLEITHTDIKACNAGMVEILIFENPEVVYTLYNLDIISMEDICNYWLAKKNPTSLSKDVQENYLRFKDIYGKEVKKLEYWCWHN